MVEGGQGPTHATENQHANRYLVLRQQAEALLVEVMNNSRAPATLRVSCAKTILNLTGSLKTEQNQDDDLDPDHLTLEDIDREIGRLT
jgi:hypothetical protein